jgi:hypothetical protein
VLVARFSSYMISENVQVFWAALQRGGFIVSDSAGAAGTYRKQGARWMVASGGVRPRRGRDLQGRYLSFAQRGGDRARPGRWRVDGGRIAAQGTENSHHTNWREESPPRSDPKRSVRHPRSFVVKRRSLVCAGLIRPKRASR